MDTNFDEGINKVCLEKYAHCTCVGKCARIHTCAVCAMNIINMYVLCMHNLVGTHSKNHIRIEWNLCNVNVIWTFLFTKKKNLVCSDTGGKDAKNKLMIGKSVSLPGTCFDIYRIIWDCQNYLLGSSKVRYLPYSVQLLFFFIYIHKITWKLIAYQFFNSVHRNSMQICLKGNDQTQQHINSLQLDFPFNTKLSLHIHRRQEKYFRNNNLVEKRAVYSNTFNMYVKEKSKLYQN